MNGMFSFHALSQAYTQFWNNRYGSTVRATAGGGAELAGDPKLNVFTE